MSKAITFIRVGTGTKIHRGVSPNGSTQGGVCCGAHRSSRSGFSRLAVVRASDISAAGKLCGACFTAEAVAGDPFDLGILGLDRLAVVTCGGCEHCDGTGRFCTAEEIGQRQIEAERAEQAAIDAADAMQEDLAAEAEGTDRRPSDAVRPGDGSVSIGDRAASLVEHLRVVGADYAEAGSEATAADYREAADLIAELVQVLDAGAVR